MSARALKLPVPTTVITGGLNSGKTTLISRISKIKPQNEVWAVLVNEFGAVGLDRIALENSAGAQGLHVKQIAGGCMCCVTGGVLGLSIAQLLRSVKPDRLLIEPSGLGHPAGLIDALQGEHLKPALQLNAVVCLVDLHGFNADTLMAEPVFADQVHLSNVLLGSKPDLATQQQQEGFLAFADQLFPPKQQVLLASAPDQQLLAVLDAPRQVAMPSLFTVRRPKQQPAANSQAPAAEPGAALAALNLKDGSVHPPSSYAEHMQLQEPEQEAQWAQQPAATTLNSSEVSDSNTGGHPQPIQRHSQALPLDGYTACGWLVNEAAMFDRDRLQQLVARVLPLAARVKGVARVSSKQWVAWGTAAADAGSGFAAAAAATAAAAQQEADSLHPEQEQLQQQMDARTGPPLAGHQVAEGHMPSHLQLQDMSYRGPSCVQVILATSAAGGRQQPAADEPSSSNTATSESLPGVREPAAAGPQLDRDSTPGAAGVRAQCSLDAASVIAALTAGQAGDWAPLEQLLKSCLK